MDNRNTLVAIAVSAILSSICTATALNLSNDSVSNDKTLSSISSQVEQLKSQLELETKARMSLQKQLSASILEDESVPSLQNNTSVEIAPTTDRELTQPIDAASQRDAIQRFRQQRRSERTASQQPDYRRQQLMSAGFEPEEAARIVQIESEASLTQLQAQYDARRERAALDGNKIATTNPIRAELGDQNYERYLDANGWPTSAQVGSIIGGSPGENAGLRAGDSIISYAGERVFNLSDINNLTIQGNLGESVLVEVQRGDDSLQVTLPRGPIGINSGRGRFGR